MRSRVGEDSPSPTCNATTPRSEPAGSWDHVGVWHFPILIYYNLTVTEMAPPVLIPILVGAVLGTIGYTIVNTWIYNSTESVFVMILLHGWYNTVNSYVVLPFENMMKSTVSAMLPWAVAVYVSKRYGDEHLADRPRPALQLEPIR